MVIDVVISGKRGRKYGAMYVKDGGKAGARHRFKPSVCEGFKGRREKDGDWRGGVIIEI